MGYDSPGGNGDIPSSRDPLTTARFVLEIPFRGRRVLGPPVPNIPFRVLHASP
ncbi:hypothetical protein GCM10022284_57860 [Streptomyces hundungensis]